MRIEFLRKQPVAAHMTTFWFTKPAGFLFTAGEYVETYLPHQNADNRGEHRKFSIASGPHEPLLGFTVHIPTACPSSFKQALLQLRPGNTIHISEPIGDFVLPKLESVPVVGVALGSGITPFMSIASHLSHSKSNRPFRLFQIAKASEDILTLPVATMPILSKPIREWTGMSGRLTAQDIVNTADQESDTLFYLAGPEHAVQILRQGLLDSGIPAINIVNDPFLGANA